MSTGPKPVRYPDFHNILFPQYKILRLDNWPLSVGIYNYTYMHQYAFHSEIYNYVGIRYEMHHKPLATVT